MAKQKYHQDQAKKYKALGQSAPLNTPHSRSYFTRNRKTYLRMNSQSKQIKSFIGRMKTFKILSRCGVDLRP